MLIERDGRVVSALIIQGGVVTPESLAQVPGLIGEPSDRSRRRVALEFLLGVGQRRRQIDNMGGGLVY